MGIPTHNNPETREPNPENAMLVAAESYSVAVYEDHFIHTGPFGGRAEDDELVCLWQPGLRRAG
jgi:hypothetical protein